MSSWINSPSIELDDSAALRLDDLLGGDVIDPRDYAEAIARAIPAKVSSVAVQDGSDWLYEIWIEGKLLARLPKEQAVCFLDGVIMGTKLGRHRD